MTEKTILDNLLSLLAEGGIHDYRELAGKLGVSPELLGEMLLGLERMGFLKTVATSCPGSCEGCPLSAECRLAGQGRVWVLTERGAERARTLG